MVRFKVIFIRFGRRRKTMVKAAEHIAKTTPSGWAPKPCEAAIHLSKLHKWPRRTSDMVAVANATRRLCGGAACAALSEAPASVGGKPLMSLSSSIVGRLAHFSSCEVRVVSNLDCRCTDQAQVASWRLLARHRDVLAGSSPRPYIDLRPGIHSQDGSSKRRGRTQAAQTLC